MTTANAIKVGDVVEFEIGSPVLVMGIEDNYGADSFEAHPGLRVTYGKSLVFSCSYTTTDMEIALAEGSNTFYVRRELSPVAGNRVVG